MQIYTPPTLYGLSSTGKVKCWYVEVSQLGDGSSTLEVTHGYLDGKKTGSSRLIETGKNLGKINETTPFEQACSEADSLWNKKKDQGYVEDKNNIPKASDVEFFLPMLAHRYDQRGKDIKFPAFCQRKFDGARCLARKSNGQTILWSRGGKVYEVPTEIIAELNSILDDGDCVDGEIYRHEWKILEEETNETVFEKTISALKARNEDTPYLQYHIYDCPTLDVPFEKRFTNLVSKISARAKEPSRLEIVQTEIISSEEEMLSKFDEFISQGYEGLMVRNIDGKYQYKNRSADLQKVKAFDDEEFEIIGGKEAGGNDVGTVVFRCRTPEGKEFDVRPKGSRKKRAEWWNNLDKYIGQILTVQFQKKSSEGIPRFPSGKGIRPSWDK